MYIVLKVDKELLSNLVGRTKDHKMDLQQSVSSV